MIFLLYSVFLNLMVDFNISSCLQIVQQMDTVMCKLKSKKDKANFTINQESEKRIVRSMKRENTRTGEQGAERREQMGIRE